MLACHSCGFSNLPRAVFCGGCGQLLDADVCPVCHADNPRGNHFCNQCGSAIRFPPAATETDHRESSTGSPSDKTPISTQQTASSFPVSLPFPSFRIGFRARAGAASVTALLSRMSTPLLISGALAVVSAQLGLYFSVEFNEKSPIGYLLLLALGVATFALGSSGLWMKRAADENGVPAIAVPGIKILDSITGTISIIIGVMATAALLIPLGAGAVSGYMLLPWFAALGAFAVPFLPQIDSVCALPRAWIREHYRDLLIVLALMTLFVALNLYDLQDWYYSAIGDEFLFYDHAKRMADTGITHPFSQEGVYNKHPVMSSVFQSVVMRVFGSDYFGWTFSETLNAALTIPGIYLLGYAFGGRKAAIASAALLSFSHLLFAFSHVGYNNLSSLPVAVWSLALFVTGWRKGNPLLLYAAGVIAGLGFYTHYSGRGILPVIFLFALTSGSPRRLLSLWPLAFGFVLTVAPIFVVEQEQVFTRMFGQVVGGYSEAVASSTGERVLNNIEINLPAFNYNSTVHSYVYGPLLDPVSAVLASLGIAFALGHIRLPSLRLLLIWFGVAAFMTGVLSPYPHVAITRLAFVVPPMVLLAGVLAGRIGDNIQLRVEKSGPLVARITASALLLSLTAAVLALNLWQFWHVTPSVFPHRPEAVALGAFRSEYCGSDATSTVFVGQAIGEGSLLEQVLVAFNPDEPLPRRLNHDEVLPDMELPGHAPRCVVFVNPGAPEALMLQGDLARRYPDGQVVAFANPARTTTVEIFTASQN